MCEGGGEDESSMWVWSWIRARKPRSCCACDRTIAKGELYHRYKSLLDGAWRQWDHCASCWQICKELWKHNGGESIDLDLACGEIWENPPPEVAELAFETVSEAQARAEADRLRFGRRETMP